MDKKAFLDELREKLSGLPEEDIEERVAFYREMIDDRMEDGISEEEAVNGLGSIESIREQILMDTPISKIVKEKIKPKRALRGWEIALLIIGSPVWVPVTAALIIVALVIYLCFWIVILCLYVCDFAVFFSGFAAIIAAFLQENGFSTGLLYCGGGIALIGAAILLFFGFTEIAKGMLFVSKKIALGIKKLFVGGKKS